MEKTNKISTGPSFRMMALVTLVLITLSIPASACTYTLGDFVWEDKDKDGMQEQGETGIPNVQVELYKEGQNTPLTTTTDSNGKYLFTGLSQGKYYVKFILPSGYVFTQPNQGTVWNRDHIDSDADKLTGMTNPYTIRYCSIDSADAGMYKHETEIPEFPTVALPVAAILGLAFVFMRKQE